MTLHCLLLCVTVPVTDQHQKHQKQNLIPWLLLPYLLAYGYCNRTLPASPSMTGHLYDCHLLLAGEHIENTLEALRALIRQDNATPGGSKALAYIEFDVHVKFPEVLLHTKQALSLYA